MRLAQRVGRLEAPRDGRLAPWARALASEVAAETGLEPEAVIQEAEAILAQAAKAGALGSAEGLAAFLAEAERWLGRR